jgi:CDP-diglyceride synthetase
MTWRGSASPNPEPAGNDETAQYPPTERYPAYGAASPQRQPAAPPPRRNPVDAKRLWTGGVATAVVAIGLTIVGFLVIHGLLHLTVLGIWPDGGPVSTPSVAGYASVAALAALLATAVMHLLLLGVPRPRFFFAWVGVLCTAIWVILPLTITATTGAKAATAILNLVIGVAITAIVHSMAAYSLRGATRTAAPSYYDQ